MGDIAMKSCGRNRANARAHKQYKHSCFISFAAFLFAFLPAEDTRSEEPSAPIEIPPIEVVVNVPKKKYPAVTVAKKTKPSARPVAALAPVVPRQPATEGFEGLTLTIPVDDREQRCQPLLHGKEPDQNIVDRTRGILPGTPHLIQAGLKQNF